MASTAINPSHLSQDTFAEKVLSDGLETIEVDGYIYARGKGKDKGVLFRAYGPKWKFLYQARRVNTQDNVAGGALITRLQVASGQTAQLVRMYVQGSASAGAALGIYIYDEDAANIGRLAVVGAGASISAYIPSIGTSATGSSNVQQSLGMMLGPGEYLVGSSTAALQTEYMTMAVVLLLSTDTEPTWDTTGSAGTPNLGASSISAANTMQAVLMP